MNRIQAACEPATDSRAKTIRVDAGVVSAVAGDNPCSIFAPLHYEPNYAYPLLVWLHGPGDDEGQLKRIMPLVSMRNYVGVAPRGTVSQGGRRAGRSPATWDPGVSHLVPGFERVKAAVSRACDRFNIAHHRVFLAGYDRGGTMALRLAFSFPRLFAGVLSICGAVPHGGAPLARLQEARRVPVFLACAKDSRQYPQERVCRDLRLLHAAGMEVSLRQYSCDHKLTTRMLSDTDHWMMDLVTRDSSAAATGRAHRG